KKGSARRTPCRPVRPQPRWSSAAGFPRQPPRTASCRARAREKCDRLARTRGGVACAAKEYARPPPVGVHMIGVLAVPSRSRPSEAGCHSTVVIGVAACLLARFSGSSPPTGIFGHLCDAPLPHQRLRHHV